MILSIKSSLFRFTEVAVFCTLSFAIFFHSNSNASDLLAKRSDYVQALESSLSEGVSIPKNWTCKQIPKGAKTTLSEEIHLIDPSGQLDAGHCILAVPIQGPVVVPAQNLTFIGCYDQDSQDVIQARAAFRSTAYGGMYLRMEDGNPLYVWCGYRDDDELDSFDKQGIFSELTVTPIVYGVKKTPDFDG